MSFLPRPPWQPTFQQQPLNSNIPKPMGFGLGVRFSRPSSVGKSTEDDEQWYIPYNGPYEPPRELSRRTRARDSWGDPVEDDEDRYHLVDKELQKRYGGNHRETDDGARLIPEAGRATGDRTTSFASGRTGSSGAVDPNRGSVVTQRRSTVSSGQRPPAPSYVHVEAGGGVGESPAPNASIKEGNHPPRLSLGSIFGFSTGSRKSLESPTTPKDKEGRKIAVRRSRPAKVKTVVKEPAKLSLQLGPSSGSSSETSPRKFPTLDQDVSDSTKVDEDDYYNTYYSTLLKGQGPAVSHHNPSFGVNPRSAPRPGSGSTISRHETFSSHSIHPYAYTFPKKDPDPPTYETSQPYQDAPKLTFDSAAKQSSARPPAVGGYVLQRQLKNSSSTPNLRAPTKTSAPRGIERWLSAETWCDALLFPRPRLKMKEEHNTYRIVSPPTTPLTDDFGFKSVGKASAPAYTSRVLAHSHSLIDLSLSKKHRPTPPPAQTSSVMANGERAPRPKSFAQDDLALINPILSLERVLEEGEELEIQRKKWQRQAASSIGNARARSLSRSRSKSLTQKGRIGGHRNQTSYDYLAARACLGSQNLTPEIAPARSQIDSFSDGTGIFSRASHSHSNSLAKSKSSKSHSRGPSRSESWTKSGSKPRVNTNNNTCLDDKLTGMEGALRRDDTKVIRLSDPAPLGVDNSLSLNSPRISPTPSGGSDIRMGIAISTPPLIEDVIDREFIRMPLHPYAQAGVALSMISEKQGGGESLDRVANHSVPQPPPSKPPPFVSSHPYALAAEADDTVVFVAHGRSDSNASPPSKMWAQLSPGVVSEVLPSDFGYSPSLADRGTFPLADRTEVVGMGEALVYPNYRDSRDSGLGTSEGHAMQPYIPSVSPLGMRGYATDLPPEGDRQHFVHREPVQYDAIRPSYAQHQHKNSLDHSSSILPVAVTAAASTNMDTLHIPKLDHSPSHSPSPARTSETSSPPLSPHSLGSPNDLDSFHDLFYKPQGTRPSSTMGSEVHQPYGSSNSGSLTGEVAIRSRRAGSGLTTLARQLSVEFEQLERERERTNSQYSYSSGSGRPKRRQGEGSLEFVFEEVPRSASPMAEEYEEARGNVADDDQDSTQIFKPSFKIPEDVHSSGSSVAERTVEDEDDTAMFRVGVVESVSTPPAEVAARRRSYTGLMSEDPSSLLPTSAGAHHSILLSPITDMTRSSYMTTSTTSRMSNLSDFPIPPKNDPSRPEHMSFVSSYLPDDNDTTLNHRELGTLRDTPHPMHPQDRRFTFGIDQDAVDVADALSNPGH